MNPILSRGLGIIAACLVCFASACDDGGVADVRAAYDEYNAALQRKDGDGFLKVIDPENIKHYDQYVKIAQRGSRAQIDVLPATGRDCVLVLRHRFKPDELAKLDGAAFVKLCVERGWFFMEDEDETFSLGPIKVNSPRASAELRVNGERTGERLDFVLVEGHWFVNDEALDRAHEKWINKVAARFGMSVDRLLFRIEAEETGDDVDPKIFDTPPIVTTPPPAAVTITRDSPAAKKAAKKK